MSNTRPPRRPLTGERARIATRMRSLNSRVNERSGRNLLSAIGIGVALVTVLLGSLLIDKRWIVVTGTLLVLALVIELATAMRDAGRHVPRVPSALVPLAVVPLGFYYGPAWQWGSLLIGLLVVTAWQAVSQLVARQRLSSSFSGDVTSSVFVQLYATFVGSFTALLVAQPEGELWALSFVIVVICVDTGAYVFGMRYGRTPLAPRISPSKSWEGIAGGGLTAIGAAVLASIFILDLPWWFGIIMGIALTVTAVAGDLTESMVKRDLGRKDMSNWLPGHGGFFDRFDSMLPSGAMAFALYFWATPLMQFNW